MAAMEQESEEVAAWTEGKQGAERTGGVLRLGTQPRVVVSGFCGIIRI